MRGHRHLADPWPRSILNAFLRRNLSIRVVFGEPFTLDEGKPTADRAEEATDLIMRRIAELMPEEYRGAYGPGSEGHLVVARHRDDDAAG